MQVIDSVAQHVPDSVTRLVRVGPLIVASQWTARGRVLAVGARVDPGKPAVHGAQQAQQLRIVRPVVLVHTGHRTGTAQLCNSELLDNPR